MMPIKASSTLLACVLMAGHVTGCDSHDASHDDPRSPARATTIVSDDETQKRLSLLDGRFSADQVCVDFILAEALIALGQRAPSNLPVGVFSPAQARSTCPRRYSELAASLTARIDALDDFHAGITFGNALDSRASPVVSACEGADFCPKALGAALVSVPSPIRGRFFSIVPLDDGTNRALAIFRLGGSEVRSLQRAIVREGEVGHTSDASLLGSAQRALTRRMLDGRDRDDASVEAWDLHSGRRVRLVVSYAPAQSIAAPLEWRSALPSLSSWDAFGCAESFEGGNASVGACVTHDRRHILRVRDFLLADQDPVLGDALAWLTARAEKPQSPLEKSALPWIIDVRGNPGGNTRHALELACRIGGERTDERVTRRAYRSNRWPAAIAVKDSEHDSIVRLDSLGMMGNLDFVDIDETWTVSYGENARAREAQSRGYLARHGWDADACRRARETALADRKWVVLTSGAEFSAAENFLSFFDGQKGNVRIVGASTKGGTGSPVTIRLPGTGIALRLSTARQFDLGKRGELIEGRGVRPHAQIQPDDEESFARRLRAFAEGALREDDIEHMPAGVRRGLDFRF
jgi:hypothetical protein